MKKIVLVVLSLMLLLSLCACSSGKGPKETTPPQETESPTTPTECVHAYAENITEEATCTKEGTKAFTCSACGDSYTESTPKLAHTYADATCTAPKTCELCGETEGEALAHSFKDATCTAPKTCSECGATEGNTLGHTYKNATCTNAKTCSVCGATSGTALGHKYENEGCTGEKTCGLCGDTKQNSHSWKDATCAAPKTCSVCGETDGEALGHSWNDATCTAPKTCSVCEETEGEALGHTLTATCTRCEYVNTEYVDLLDSCAWCYTSEYYSEEDDEYPEFSKWFFHLGEDGNLSHFIKSYSSIENFISRYGYGITAEEFKADPYHYGIMVVVQEYVMINGTEYYVTYGRSAIPPTTYTVENGIVTLMRTFIGEETAVLERTGYAEYTVTGGTLYPIGDKFSAVLDHTFEDATCSVPKTCLVCGATEGEPLDHSFANGFCTACGEEDPECVKITDCTWNYINERYDEEDDQYPLHQKLFLDFSENGKLSFTQKFYLSLENEVSKHGITTEEWKKDPYSYGCWTVIEEYVMINGTEYYLSSGGRRIFDDLTYTIEDGIITVCHSDILITFERTGLAEYTITSISGDYPFVSVGAKFTAGCVEHTFRDATCTSPETCTVCGSPKDDVVDPDAHNLTDATCTTPSKCTMCGETEGEPLDHDFANGLCTVCGEEDPACVKLTDCTWTLMKAYYQNPSDQIPTLHEFFYTFDENGEALYEMQCHISVENAAKEWGGTVEEWKAVGGGMGGPYYMLNGAEYFATDIDGERVTYTEENGIVTTSYNALDDQHVFYQETVVLQRTGLAEYTVISLSGTGYPYLSVGDRFTPVQ